MDGIFSLFKALIEGIVLTIYILLYSCPILIPSLVYQYYRKKNWYRDHFEAYSTIIFSVGLALYTHFSLGENIMISLGMGVACPLLMYILIATLEVWLIFLEKTFGLKEKFSDRIIGLSYFIFIALVNAWFKLLIL